MDQKQSPKAGSSGLKRDHINPAQEHKILGPTHPEHFSASKAPPKEGSENDHDQGPMPNMGAKEY